MILIGHSHIISQSFIHIDSMAKLEQVLKTPNEKKAQNHIFWFSASEDKDFSLSKFCAINNIDFAIAISNIKECILHEQYAPKYLIALTSFVPIFTKNNSKDSVSITSELIDFKESFNLAKTCQNIADSYLFDSKILAIINSEEEIESIALNCIDGAIFLSALLPL